LLSSASRKGVPEALRALQDAIETGRAEEAPVAAEWQP